MRKAWTESIDDFERVRVKTVLCDLKPSSKHSGGPAQSRRHSTGHEKTLLAAGLLHSDDDFWPDHCRGFGDVPDAPHLIRM
jgi:hypothetical protein